MGETFKMLKPKEFITLKDNLIKIVININIELQKLVTTITLKITLSLTLNFGLIFLSKFSKVINFRFLEKCNHLMLRRKIII